MKIKRMTATFGRLEGAVLELREGLNILQAPNEGGKSTWCAFLRAMLYGIPTRERDTKTTLAEKNRYAPWSGSPMAGEMLLTWRGRDILLRRFARGASPFGGFEAVDAATGEPIPGLTGENCGETLLGVGREVFQRSAFVGQSGLPVDADPELERRIAALVSSGEEGVSFSEAEQTLKGWLNRRKHNKTGLIPKLEGELGEVERQCAAALQNQRLLQESEVQAGALEARRTELEAEQAAQRARQDWVRLDQYRSAAQDLEEAQSQLSALEREAGPLPDKEALGEAQGDLAYFNALSAGLKEARGRQEAAQAALEAAQAEAEDPRFSGLDPEDAWDKASRDADRVRALAGRTGRGLPAAGVLLLLAAGALGAGAGLLRQPLLLAAAAVAAAAGAALLLTARRQAAARRAEGRRLLARYGVEDPDGILEQARAYREKRLAAEEARRTAQAAEEARRDLTVQREALLQKLLAFVHGFAPAATDLFGVSTALSRALTLGERLAAARVKVQGARKLLDTLPEPTPENNVILRQAQGGKAPAPPPPMTHTPQQTAAALSAVTGELQRVREALSHARGQRTALGDPEELGGRREALSQDLEARRQEYQALTLALEALEEANGQLRARFSPALNQRAGAIFSALTGGKYQEVTLTRELEASAREAGDIRPRRALTLSRGTVDQLYLAVRLAVCQLALPGEDPAPLVLDDALSDFDDSRMALALNCLLDLSRERQVLLFTCHSREQRWMEQAGGAQ